MRVVVYPMVSIRTGPWGSTASEGSLWDLWGCGWSLPRDAGVSLILASSGVLHPPAGQWCRSLWQKASGWGAGGEVPCSERPQHRAVLGGVEGLQPPASAQAAGQQAGAAGPRGWHPSRRPQGWQPSWGLRPHSDLPVPPPGCSFVHVAARWCHRAWVLQAKKPDRGFCQYNANCFFFLLINSP